MISDARGNHVSPGIYTEERDVTYSVQSLGITSLGLAGETLYGPAFENVEIESWSDFIDYFGGTSPEKFKNGKPKYELPYIAKSYLEESRRLNVVRVLGLSGYHAGPVWAIIDKNAPGTGGTASNQVILVLRSKMTYSASSGDICAPNNDDMPTPIVTGLTVGNYNETFFTSECVENSGSMTASSMSGNGYFSIEVKCKAVDGFNTGYTYNVSLDPSSNNYVYKVLSNKPDTGTTPVYIEALYEASWTGGKIDSKCLCKFDTSVTGETDETYENYDNFKEAYRAAQTPWIVSEATIRITGDTEDSTSEEDRECSMKKLFKFITISDGDASNYQVKVSIQNIKPSEGTFDVIVRDFNDTDSNPMILERFSNCNLVEGDSGFIGYKIGTSDGGYEAKSKYILVEMASGEDLSNSFPAGFLGYPMPKYSGSSVFCPAYNTEYRTSTKPKKQYFGFSNITGVDNDLFSYKGRHWYTGTGYGIPGHVTPGFHMDSCIAGKILIDGEDNGYEFVTVSKDKVTDTMFAPRLINAAYINQTIYSDINLRKFTVYFYGGFDGWDVNREERTNTNAYKASNYSYSGSNVFELFSNNIESDLNLPLNLPSTAITSDYYAYLAGYRVFANPQDVDINVFATPGINWYDHQLLTEEAIDIVEDSDDGRGGDALYIMAPPSDYVADELASLFEESEINSSYACTYAPWVMYYDSTNRRYLNLPVTKDVVRNLASTDNTSYPWFAPAGILRGNVNCVKAEYKTTLAQEDTLYENRINPVKTFASDGVKIWGNKTAYNVDSPLNRVNVRRLMIRVKKLISDAARSLIFEQYDDTLEQQFKSIVEPILSDVKSNRGITDYRLITEVTAEAKDQHILPAKILIKPTPSLEYISLSFVIYPESVEFDEN